MTILHLRCYWFQVLQLNRKFMEGWPLCWVQIPSLAHHVIYFGGTAFGTLHLVSHFDVFSDFSERLKIDIKALGIVFKTQWKSLRFLGREHDQMNKFPKAKFQNSKYRFYLKSAAILLKFKLIICYITWKNWNLLLFSVLLEQSI